MRQRNVARRSQSCSFESALFWNVMRKCRVGPAASWCSGMPTWLCATRSIVATSWKIWCLLSLFILSVLVLYIRIYIIYIMSCTEELDKQLIDWKTSLKTEEFLEFHLTVHKIISHPTGEVFVVPLLIH
jgi:hypothetical protein